MGPVPVTVLTGYVGSGKTTLILSLVKKLAPGYKVVLLKNEFGDVEVDSQLAREGGIAGVEEMLNGCMCCVLVGQMETALRTLKDTYKPDRIIVETSGSAFPGPVAWKIRQLEPEGFKLDAIITVVDCVNFRGYADTSYTAKLQAKYSDVILLTKHELVSEREVDDVLDRVLELNPDTPILKTRGRDGVSVELLLGLDTRLFATQQEADVGATPSLLHSGGGGGGHYDSELDTLSLIATSPVPGGLSEVVAALAALPTEHVFRVKGVLVVPEAEGGALVPWLVNIAFGRYDPPTRLTTYTGSLDERIRLSFIGLDLGNYIGRVRGLLGLGGERDPIPPGVSLTLHSRPLM